ncbi:MAG TPA: cupredoxin family copper-binding protein [Alphaproteobacteria bacterium]|nr:cupredoxin family copper-binding protein [Alphaproteobacteria bacterium]
MIDIRAIAAAAGIMVMFPAAASAADHAVSIKGFKFVPAEITVAAGDTITFTNEDSAPHTATASDGSFDTGRLNKGESGRVTINSAGTFDYICEFHPMMKGKVLAQ